MESCGIGMTKEELQRKVTIETLLSVRQTTGQGFLPGASR